MSDEPDDSTREASAYYRALLKPVFRDRDFVLIGGPVLGLVGLATSLRLLGAGRLFLLGSAMGTGPPPDPELAQWHSLDLRPDSIRDEFIRYEGALRNLPDQARAALDRFDPEHHALATGAIVLSDVPDIDGRARYARRQPAWGALEDKIAIETFWSEIAVRVAPSKIVAVDPDSLRRASRRLDRGQGCVWAGDSRDGNHGGAELTRWIRDSDDASRAVEVLSAHCDRVRVMPFLEGVPCSIHGMVLPDHVAVFRPVEMVVLRRRDPSEFVYAGVATFWDPPDAGRAEMRSLARRVGEALRDRVDYRGVFTIDGVLNADGFWPTEMNPRIGAGLGPISMALPTLPLQSLALAAAEGEALDYRGEWLESTVVEASDRRRFGRGSTPLRVGRDATETRRLTNDADGYRFAVAGEAGDASFVWGPGSIGSFFSFHPDESTLPAGPLFAPEVVAAFALADREWSTGIGALHAAVDTARG